MAKIIGIMGDFGTGKSTSTENLDPSKTLYINYLGTKDLVFKGARKKYRTGVSDNVEGSNLINSPPASIIPTLITTIPQLPRFKIAVLDDISYTMTNEFIDTAKQVGFTKFTNMAVNFKALITACEKSPLDWIIIMLHSDPVYNGSEIVSYKIKTVGKMIDSAVRIEGLFSILLATDVRTDDEGKTVYEFVTNREGIIMAKSPKDMLPQRMPNDVSEVIRLAEEYYNNDEN